MIDDGCPHKQFALLDRRTNQSRICTAGEESSCPKGFFCQFSAKRGQFQCCGQSGGCPRGRAAFIAIDGNAQECLPGPNMCQDGYECMKSSIANKNICCSEEANECADNEQLINGSCVISVKPGGACQKSEECAGGSSCIDHTCTCPPEKIVQKDKCVDKECTANQIRIDGICVDRADIGQACKSSLQCVANSHCISGRCDCSKDEKVENNKCVKKKKGEESEDTNKKEKEKEKANSGSGSSETDEKLESEDKKKTLELCPSGQEPYYEKGTHNKMRTCSKIDDDCPFEYKCHFSQQTKQNICCGDPVESRIKPTKSGRTKIGTSSGKPPIKGGHCPTGMSPYLINGKAKSCASGVCPYGYQCKFSSLRKDYYCCSRHTRRVSSNSGHLMAGGCERGSVLLYPSTREPVLCDPLLRGCPNGFLCLPHIKTKVHQCCSVELIRDENEDVEVTCPGYMVKVTKEIDGQQRKVCARTCPKGQRAVNGVCQ
ncbi:hypothetical protein WR25_14815 [Diploscapter pachys]|uniref:EB domain-containing protein n=1 Tax=Diploscapter pachys TaxID=2018661 RepID=A0A2A2M0F0_9BILA|nr:hypothetical protein WR25_14815 [Diploscapter pachys]